MGAGLVKWMKDKSRYQSASWVLVSEMECHCVVVVILRRHRDLVHGRHTVAGFVIPACPDYFLVAEEGDIVVERLTMLWVSLSAVCRLIQSSPSVAFWCGLVFSVDRYLAVPHFAISSVTWCFWLVS